MKIEVVKMKNTKNSYHFDYYNGLDALKLTSEEEALPPLKQAFADLLPIFLKATELQPNKEYRITGLSLSGEDLNKAVITGQCSLASGKTLIINSPVFDSDEINNWDSIEKLQAEATKYIKGLRRFSQTTLFDQDFDKNEDVLPGNDFEVERQKIELDDDIQALDSKIRAKKSKKESGNG